MKKQQQQPNEQLDKATTVLVAFVSLGMNGLHFVIKYVLYILTDRILIKLMNLEERIEKKHNRYMKQFMLCVSALYS